MLVQAKESKKSGPCANPNCKETVYQGKAYIWDTDEKKAYHSKECAEAITNRKVVENSGAKTSSFSSARGLPQQLWRTPEEAGAAIQIWHNAVIPMILQTTEQSMKVKVSNGVPDVNIARYDNILQFWTKTYKEIFLGKMEGVVNKG